MSGASVKEELHLQPKLSMFCALSQNNQYIFHVFEKFDISILRQIVWKSLNYINISVVHAILELLIETCSMILIWGEFPLNVVLVIKISLVISNSIVMYQQIFFLLIIAAVHFVDNIWYNWLIFEICCAGGTSAQRVTNSDIWWFISLDFEKIIF